MGQCLSNSANGLSEEKLQFFCSRTLDYKEHLASGLLTSEQIGIMKKARVISNLIDKNILPGETDSLSNILVNIDCGTTINEHNKTVFEAGLSEEVSNSLSNPLTDEEKLLREAVINREKELFVFGNGMLVKCYNLYKAILNMNEDDVNDVMKNPNKYQIKKCRLYISKVKIW